MPDKLSGAWLLIVFLTSTTPIFSQTVLSYSPATAETATTTSDIFTNHSSDSASSKVNEELGKLMMYRRRYQAAIEAFKKIEFPSAMVWNQIGIAYQMMYDYEDAKRSYDEALRLNPHDSIVLGNLATAQEGMGDFTAAEKNYRKSLQLNPTSAMTLKNLGTNLLMQHRYEAGEAAYKQALAIDARIFEDHPGFKMNDPAPKSERGIAAYFKAKSCAQAGMDDCAIAFLRVALYEGLTQKQLSREQDFAALRETAAFSNLVAAKP